MQADQDGRPESRRPKGAQHRVLQVCDGLYDVYEVVTVRRHQGPRLLQCKNTAELHDKGIEDLPHYHSGDPDGNLHHR